MTNPQHLWEPGTSTREGMIELIRQARISPPQRKEEEQYERDKYWLRSNREDLLAEYEEMWVAVYGEEVTESHRNLDKLIEALRERGVKASDTVIEYLTTREFSMLL